MNEKSSKANVWVTDVQVRSASAGKPLDNQLDNFPHKKVQ